MDDSDQAAVEGLSGELRRALADTTSVGLLRCWFMEALGNAALERAECCAEQGIESEARHHGVKWRPCRAEMSEAEWAEMMAEHGLRIRLQSCALLGCTTTSYLSRSVARDV